MGKSNRERVKELSKKLIEVGYNELAEVMTDMILSTPVYAERTLKPQDFVSEITDVLHGLSTKDLGKFVSDHQSLERAHTITLQAMMTKNALFISNGAVCLALNSFEQSDLPD